MCTATVVPIEDGFRLAFNRDERRTRPTASPPAVRRVGKHLAIFPLDPRGGGTWIGVNDLGLAAALLNRTVDAGASRTAQRSRGLIVPAILEAGSLDRALRVAETLALSRFNLFRLLLVRNGRTAVVTSDGTRVFVEHGDLTRPLMLTSSSLGDAVVEGPRRRLFRELFNTAVQAWPEAQAIFHAHRWAERPQVSVLMSRLDARTFSQSLMTISSRSIRFQYAAIPDSIPQVS